MVGDAGAVVSEGEVEAGSLMASVPALKARREVASLRTLGTGVVMASVMCMVADRVMTSERGMMAADVVAGEGAVEAGLSVTERPSRGG